MFLVLFLSTWQQSPFLSTRLKGQISHYQEYWPGMIPIFRFEPHYNEKHKAVLLIEPDTGCKLIRAKLTAASKCPDCHGKAVKVFFVLAHHNSD